MRNANLADAYAISLETGLWPNMDVLPATERAIQGDPLAEMRHVWRYSARDAA